MNAVATGFSKNLFWDIDLGSLDMEKHAGYIVERVLDNGQLSDWYLIYNYYGLDRIRDITTNIRSLLPSALSFISLITQTPEDKFRCYEQIHSKNTHWIC
jgi:hypothetical protein